MKKNKILFPTLILLLATLLLIFLPTEAEGALYDDTIRLHILAPSDADEDQALKIKVRDALLLKYSSELTAGECKADAERHLREILPEIREYCESVIKEYGYNYSVEATLTNEWYDTREYEGFTLPQGIYTSLKIIIGEGEGKNWWCVMYPPLCLELATESAPRDDAVGGLSSEEITLISGNEYRVKFKLLELFSSAFS